MNKKFQLAHQNYHLGLSTESVVFPTPIVRLSAQILARKNCEFPKTSVINLHIFAKH